MYRNVSHDMDKTMHHSPLYQLKVHIQGEYTPSSKFGKWFNDRLPLLTLTNHLTDYPTPKNLNYWWTFGGILTFCLITQIVTGLVLAMHYLSLIHI